MTNRKSLNNLVFWSEEVLEGDAESGIRNVPTLLIGTKQNEVSIGRRSEINERSKRMAEEIGAQTLNLDTSDPKVMAPGGTIKIGMDIIGKTFCTIMNLKKCRGFSIELSSAHFKVQIHPIRPPDMPTR